jgi:hypothetical protein
MAAATALAIASAAAGGIQAIVGGIQRNKAERAARRATRGKRGVIEEGVMNQYAGLQAPTEAFDLAEEQTQRTVTDATVAAREAGAEGVIGGVGNIVQAQQQAGLQTAAQRAQAEFDVDKMKAAEQARIDQMKYQDTLASFIAEEEGAGKARAEGMSNIYAGLTGVTGGLAAGIAGLGNEEAGIAGLGNEEEEEG